MFNMHSRFKKDSRYYHLQDVVLREESNHARASKAWRRLPTIAAQFQHRVDANDRLDHLAFKYYQKSRHWWRICDANPEFASPLALLGQDTTRTSIWQVQWQGFRAPWYALRLAVQRLLGVVQVRMGVHDGIASVDQVATTRVLRDPPVGTLVGTLLDDLQASLLSQRVSPALDAAFQALGFTLSAALSVWRDASEEHTGDYVLEDSEQQILLVLRHNATSDVITLYPGLRQHDWQLTAQWNSTAIAAESIAAGIELAGFSVLDVRHLTRVERPINIPPPVAG